MLSKYYYCYCYQYHLDCRSLFRLRNAHAFFLLGSLQQFCETGNSQEPEDYKRFNDSSKVAELISVVGPEPSLGGCVEEREELEL